MTLIPGKVVDGRIEIEGAPIPDGTVVTVLTQDSDASFDASPEEEARLLVALAEADAGLGADPDSLFSRLPSSR